MGYGYGSISIELLKTFKRVVVVDVTFERFNNLKELGRFVILEKGKIIGGGII